MKVKKIPLRKCVATNEQLPKSEMFRIVRTPEETVCVDTTGKVRGHGAYLKKDKTVIMNAKKKKVLDRYLEIPVPEEIYEQLLELLK
ncbi:MAG: YlxR family protein [Bacilli bacterium]|nr:YlxR family protein [Bacilli bacterium]